MPDDAEIETSMKTASQIVQAALQRERERERDLKSLGAGDDATTMRQMDHVEELLAAIVEGVTGVAHVQRNTRFSALGGNSLMATRVLSRVWRSFGVKLPLSSLIPDGSVSSLADAIRGLRDVEREIEPAPRRVEHGPMDVSPNQAAIWFMESLGHADGIYNIPYCLRIEGPLDVETLRRSLGEVLMCHEALQLRFEAHAGRIVQERVSLGRGHSVGFVDLSETSGTRREAVAMDIANRCIRTPFDLSRAPLARALLIEVERERHMLVLAIHHIVCDAWSLKIMMRQLSERYNGSRCQRRESAELGFLDFVAWQRSALGRGVAERLVAEWREVLRDAPDMRISIGDHVRNKQPSGVGAVEPIELDVGLVARLRELSGDQATTLYMTLLAAFAVVLSELAKADNVTIGAPIANRLHESFEEVVGYIANMVPIRVDCSGDPTFRELLARVRDAALSAYDRQTLPFAQLVAELSPSRIPGVNPLFQVALIVNDLAPQALGPARVSQVSLHTGTAKLDLTCYLEEREGRLSGYLEYATDLFRPATVTGLRIAFERTLEAMLEYVDQPLSCVAPVPSREDKARYGETIGGASHG